MKSRARRIVQIVAVAALLGAVIAGAGGWYLLGEERRTGRIVAGVLSGRLGVPITVERAVTRGTSLRLSGVRVPAVSGGSPVEIEIGQLDIEGGVLPLIVPAGRRLTIVAASTSVTVRDGVESKDPTAAIEALRSAAATLLRWPGAFSLRVDGGQLTRAGHTFALELAGDKTTSGLTLTLALLDAGARALRLTTQSTGSADDVVATRIDFPAGAPRMESRTARSTVRSRSSRSTPEDWGNGWERRCRPRSPRVRSSHASPVRPEALVRWPASISRARWSRRRCWRIFRSTSPAPRRSSLPRIARPRSASAPRR